MNGYKLISTGLRAIILVINLCILAIFSLSLYTFSSSIMALTSNPEGSIKVTFDFDNSTREYYLNIDFYIINTGFLDMSVTLNGFLSLTNGSIIKSASASSVIPPNKSLMLRLPFRFSESEILMYDLPNNPPYLTLELGFRYFFNLIGLNFHIGNIRLGGGS